MYLLVPYYWFINVLPFDNSTEIFKQNFYMMYAILIWDQCVEMKERQRRTTTRWKVHKKIILMT